jgi:hypothetical protein
MLGLIDPPSRFAPKTQWREFLDRMMRLPQDEPQVRAAVQEARKALERPQIT